MKKVYALQPHEIGSKHSKSLVVLIPSKVAKACQIDTATIFTLKADGRTKTVTLQSTVPSEIATGGVN
jgi:hypothetical protein